MLKIQNSSKIRSNALIVDIKEQKYVMTNAIILIETSMNALSFIVIFSFIAPSSSIL
jgi:hypothetical protein